MIIWLSILVSVSIVSGCIGDEPETTVTVRRVKMPEEDEPKTGVSKSPPQSPPEDAPGSPPQSPPEDTSRGPLPPMDLGEPTPEEEEEAKIVALEDERVQTLLQGKTYELKVVGCRLSPDGEPQYLLVLELENGETFIIIVNMSQSIVTEIREGGVANQKDRGGSQGKGENDGKSGEPP
jgi:hypothetical protein